MINQNTFKLMLRGLCREETTPDGYIVTDVIDIGAFDTP
jgi:hypothetical protein